MAGIALQYKAKTSVDVFYSYAGAIKRDGIEDLVVYLHQNGFFTSPSSGAYHGSHEGGNLDHSIYVTSVLCDLRNTLAPNLNEESCLIVGLFHDIGKAGYFNKPLYIENTLKGGKRSDSKPFKSNPDRLPIPHQVVSLHIISKFMQLTEEETFAILYHNGLYTPDGRSIMGQETPLMMLLHWADMWASRVLEVTGLETEELLKNNEEVF